MNNIKFLLIGTSLSFLSNLAFAQCVATQDCETLGYTETSCSGGKGVKCPFGNKWACIGITAEQCGELGFTYDCSEPGKIGVGKDCSGKYQGCTCDSAYAYTCSGTGYAGGSGATCDGKYAQCSCSSGYDWKDGRCQINNGEAVGNLYYCNGKVVGVKTSSMNFYLSMADLGSDAFYQASDQCKKYTFCGNLKGILPSKDQLLLVYNQKSQINSLLTANGGSQMSGIYWTSTSVGGNAIYTVSMYDGSTPGAHTDYYDPHKIRPILSSW